MSESLTSVEDALNQGVLLGIVLATLVVVVFETAKCVFRLRVTSEVSVIFFPTALLWDLGINYYLLYHRVTIPLPTWVTSGHPVAYGGVVSKVCHGPKPWFDDAGDGGWACFPSGLETWYANVASPEGWKYLAQPPAKLFVCLLFLAYNAGMLALLVTVLRQPGFLFGAARRNRERRRRNEERTRCEKWTQCAEMRLSELVKSEKQ